MGEKLMVNNQEQFKQGYNVEVHVLFTRHAEKDSHGGDITEQGQQDARDFGKAVKRLKAIKGYDVEPATHSGHKRTSGTAYLLNNPDVGPESFKKLDIEERRLTGPTLNSSVDRYSEAADEAYAKLAAGDYQSEQSAVEYFANLKDVKYDETTPSSVEMSRYIAEDLLAIVEATKEMPSNSKKFLPNIVHSGIFEHFLIDVLKKRGEESPIKEIGGSLGFLGSDDFRMYIKRDTPDHVALTFRFRDRKADGSFHYSEISEEELRLLAKVKD